MGMEPHTIPLASNKPEKYFSTDPVKMASVTWCLEERPYLPQLIAGTDVLAREECDVWEAEILVRGEHSHRKQVWLAHVVDESADVAVEPGVDTVDVAYLQEQRLGNWRFKIYLQDRNIPQSQRL